MTSLPREIDGLIYRLATLSDTEAVWNLMAAEFYPRTPLCSCLQMRLPDDVEILRSLLPGILEHGATLVAEDKAAGKVVGARPSTIDQIVSDPNVGSSDDHQSRHPLLTDSALAARYCKCSTVYRMFDFLASKADLAEIYKADRAISFKFLVVAETHSRRGIATRLVELSLDLARSLSLPLAITCTASVHSERIYSALGFDRVADLRLIDFVDPLTGDKPFASMDETVLRDAVLYAKKL